MDFCAADQSPTLCPVARHRAVANIRQPARCLSCLKQRWNRSVDATNRGSRFTGRCGADNFCACLQVNGVRPVTLILQARRRGNYISPTAFNDALALTRLIIHDLESTARARKARGQLDSALRQLSLMESEATRLRGRLRERQPGAPSRPLQAVAPSHARTIVETMLDCVRRRGDWLISLEEVASAMKMNASYLSTLFHQTTGVAFHHFLEEIRLSKAKELLRDPRNRIREVAGAVGYSSADAFRHAFKTHEGLSPRTWRSSQ
jgi:AraC-like DNA-binding protein